MIPKPHHRQYYQYFEAQYKKAALERAEIMAAEKEEATIEKGLCGDNVISVYSVFQQFKKDNGLHGGLSLEKDEATKEYTHLSRRYYNLFDIVNLDFIPASREFNSCFSVKGTPKKGV